MATKMKGLFKGLRYISQIFDEKHKEMQIGGPTDVKHVAHIGWEGPSALDSPSWMKEFKSSNGVHSAPLTMTGEPQVNDQVKWVSQDSGQRIPRGRNSPDQHSSSREVSLTATDNQDLEHSRKKTTSKDSSSQRSRSARQPNSSGSGLPGNQEDLKKTRSTRQPKERVSGSDCDQEGSTRRGRSTRQPKDQNSESESSVDPEGSVRRRKKSKEHSSDPSVDPEGSRRTRSSRQPKDQHSGSESPPVDPEGSVKSRKKSKDSTNGGTTKSKSKANAPLPPASPQMDIGLDQQENKGDIQ